MSELVERAFDAPDEGDAFDDPADGAPTGRRDGDFVAPRVQIPSEREVALGLSADFAFTPPPPPAEREPLWKVVPARLKEVATDLNPIGIAAGGPKLPLVVFSLSAVLGASDTTAVAMLMIIVKADLNFNWVFYGFVMGTLNSLTLILAPLMGYLADRVSRVWMLRIGALFSHGGVFLAAVAPTPGMFAAARAISVVGPGIENPAKLPLLGDYYPIHTRARLFSLLGIASQLGGLLPILVFTVFVQYRDVSWRTVLFGFGSLASVIALGTFLLKDPVRGGLDRKTLGASDELAQQEQQPVSWAEGWRTCWHIGTLRRIWFATPFIGIGQQVGVLAMFVMFSKIASAPATGAAGPGAGLMAKLGVYAPYVLMMFPMALSVVALAFSAPIADRLLQHKPGKILPLMGGMTLLQSMGMLVMVVLPMPQFQMVGIVLAMSVGALAGLFLPAQSMLLMSVIPPRVRGFGMQSIAWFQLPGLMVMPLVYHLAFQIGPVAGIVVLVGVLLIGVAIMMSGGLAVARDIRAAQAASLAEQEVATARSRGAAKMIVCRDIDVHYDGTQVLFGVDFDVEEGELVALLGTNGAGKSTLLKAIGGLQPATTGAVYLDGEDITYKPPHLNARDGIVFVPGGRAIFPTLTVEENFRAAAWLYKDDEKEFLERQEQVLGYFPNLRERWGAQAGNMSGGEQQMLALGQAFLMKPRLLMIDELSLGLAPQIVEQLLEIVRAIHAQGTTVVLVEQSVNVALNIAKRAVFMEKGEVRFDGPTEELLSRQDLVRAVFLGGSSRALTGPGGKRQSVVTGEGGPILTTADLRVSYGGVQALRGVSLDLRPREIVGIIGPNGAGKSTLFDAISGFAAVEGGEVVLDGVDITGLSPDARARLGLARSFQNSRLVPSLSVRENIALALERRITAKNPVAAALWTPQVRRGERRIARRVDHLIELLHLGPFAEKFVTELSTGSRRMVDLALAIASEPKVVMLDEPSSGMAQGEVEMLGPMIKRLAKETDAGVLLIEHDLSLILDVSDRLLAMELGASLAQGAPEDVMQMPEVVSSYLRASESAMHRSGRSISEALGLPELETTSEPT